MMEGSYKDIQSWFLQEVYYWRLTRTVLWTSIAQLFMFVFVTFLLNFNVFEPFRLFEGGLSFFLSLISFGFVLTVITVLLVFSFASNYKLSAVVFSTVFETIVHLIHHRRLSSVLGFTFVGGFSSFLYLSAAESPYSVLTKDCEQKYGGERSELCLNSNYVLLLLSGCYVGFVYGIGVCIKNYNYVSFPIIQQSKFIQIKGTLLSKLKEAMTDCLTSIKWFLLVYSLFGFQIQRWLSLLLNLPVVLTSWLAVLLDVVDVHLLWTAFLVATAINFHFLMASYLFRVFQTERFSFAVESPFESDKCRTLANALKCVQFPLVRYLGFLDLSLVCQQSPSKRRDIFNLSQIGGHPHNWNEVANECLELVHKVTERIKTFCEPQPSSKKLSENTIVTEKHYSSPSKLNSTDLTYELWKSQRSFAVSPVAVSRSPQKSANENSSELPFPFNLLPLLFVCLKRSFLQKIFEFWTSVTKYHLFEFFFKESQEISIRKIFVESQLDIWAIEAISFLVAASFKEDKYGVVQKDLPDILTSLLDLHQALKRLQKMETGILKNTSKLSHPVDRLKTLLKSTIKLALYRISTTFGNHLTSISLSNENRNQLNQFLTFQE